MTDSAVSASDWSKGISLSILASIIGGASKLAIRKSWLMEEDYKRQLQQSLRVLVTDQDEEDANADPLHQRQSTRLAHEEEQDTQHDGDTIGVPVQQQQQQQPRQAKGGDALLPRRSKSNDEDTLSLRFRRPVSRSTSTSDISVDLEDVDVDDEDVILRRSKRKNSDFDVADVDVDDDEEILRDSKRKLLYARILRGSGMIGMTLLNPLACVLAMNYASPSILAPFSGLTLVWIVLLSNPVIGEQPTFPQIMAACLIISGEVIVAIFGDHTNDEGVTVEDVRDSYFRSPFLLYFAALTLWMLLMFHWMHHRSVSPTLKRFAWGVSSGSITGLQNFLKDSSTLLKATRAPGQGLPWYLPLLAILAIGSAFSGLLLLTACMKRYDATYSAAMFVGSFVISASIMSAAHYSTFAHLETLWNKILYPCGLLILIGGVLMLAKEKKEPPDDDAEDSDDSTPGVSVRSESETSPSKTQNCEMQQPLLPTSGNRIV